jgi:hypothetical protein
MMMESALPRVGRHVRHGWNWVIKSSAVGAVALVVLTAVATYAVTARLNTVSSVQQQHLAALQSFIESGSQLDASVTDLVDSVADSDDVKVAKKEVRKALSAHAAASQSLAPIVGKANVDAYLVGIGTVRQLVDQTDNSQAALNASQARFDVMHNRTLIVAEARKQIHS